MCDNAIKDTQSKHQTLYAIVSMKKFAPAALLIHIWLIFATLV